MPARAIPNDAVPELVAELRAGLSATDAGRCYGTTRNAVYRAAERLGLDARLGKRPDVDRLRREVEDMPAGEAVAFLLDLVEAAFPECRGDDLRPLVAAGFTVQEARVLAALHSCAGRAMARDALCARIATGADMTSPEVLKVVICRVRRKLAALGWPVNFLTIWGFGYRLEITRPGWSWSAPGDDR